MSEETENISKQNIGEKNKIINISYKGKTIQTKHYAELTQEEYEKIVAEYYKKPDINEVRMQIVKLSHNSTENNHVTNYYFKDLMAKTRVYYNKWSIEEVLEYKPLVEFFIGKAQENKKIFPDTMSISEKLETAFRLSGKGVASKPANFPIKTVDYILDNYNVNNNYYDFSCGWGSRLTSALKNKVNYYGTDPNYLLTDRLKEFAQEYKNTMKQNTIVDIRTQGSEKFVNEWENKMGVAFSSPPYFCLEDYRVGEQSYSDGVSYESWKTNYLKPTFQNIYRYLIDRGYFILNINNFEKYNLVGDSINIANECGFTLIRTHELENISRCISNGGFNDSNEKIMVFMKKGFESDYTINQQISLF